MALPPQDEPVVKVVEKVRPAVVNIYTERIVEQQVVDPIDAYMNQFFGGAWRAEIESCKRRYGTWAPD